ncbi:PP2C family protein-serine/threonine phosphatase [Tundrisphaera sp. TA3]|uniref:PP2C family protein-serine/threonine phosphatase n=1 Tax=Tundrisphaera sp. TA3 TaxID=3435775 RepID=UPI003EBB01EF
MAPHRGFFDAENEGWREKLDHVVETMREMSLHDDPQEMVRAYAARVRRHQPTDGHISLSRRGLESPYYRITRSTRWTEAVDPWREKDRLPLLKGGLLGELIYGDRPRIIDDLKVGPDDPAFEYLDGFRSLMAIPHFDRGEAINMVISLRKAPAAFPAEQFPDWVQISSLFGRATQNLVLSAQLKDAYAVVERELKIVADIQRSLLPKKVPTIPTLDIAASYQTSRWAGGDYYDFFALPEGKWGILIADVSGHGTPAAVLMAVMHSLAHGFPGPHGPPSALLDRVNQQLATLYTADNESFVTAFYGIYDPERRELAYSSAGHNPPRLKHCDSDSVELLEGARGLPLGLFAEEVYENTTLSLVPGDRLVFYTDGITEANSPDGQLFGEKRLDDILGKVCGGEASELVEDVLREVRAFTGDAPPADDQTLLGVVVS